MSAKRTRWRWPGILLAVIGVIALFVVVRWTYRLSTATPAPVVDYAAKMTELAGSHQPEGPDGWDLFVQAAALTAIEFDKVQVELTESGRTRPGMGVGLDFGAGLGDPLDLELVAPERRVLEAIETQGVLERLDEAAACPRAVRPIPGPSPLFNILLPELSQFRNLARARAFSMRLAAEAGDEAARLRAFEHMLGLGRAPASQTILIDRLVGIATISLALQELRCELVEHPIDEATGRALLDAMDRQLIIAPPTVALRGEQLFALDMIQYGFTDDGHGDGRMDLAKMAAIGGGAPGVPTGTGLLGRARSLMIAGRAETTEVVNRFYEGTIALAEMTPTDRKTAPFHPDRFVEGLGARHWFARIFLPAIGKSINVNDSFRVQIVVTRTAIALEMYRARHGALPDTLDALAPDFLPAKPIDPTHGGPLVYRLEEAAPGGYELYSTGVDEIDDSGSAPDFLARELYRDPNSVTAPGKDFRPRRTRDVRPAEGE
ncbi:MAG: hypothetical protein ACYTGP_10485 [Planctomycetota bacterium]